MKKSFLLLVFCSLMLNGQAQVTKTVSVTQAGTLSTFFTPNELTTVTDLVLDGPLDATDFKFMRDQLTVLANLDLYYASIVAYTGTAGPGGTTFTTYPANELPAYAFYYPSNNTGKTTLTQVTLPSSITAIGTYAFKKAACATLTVPDGVTAIRANCFQAALLTSITLPASLTRIETFAFSYITTSNLAITLPTNCNSLGASAFDSSTALKSINLPDSLVGLFAGAVFRNCTKLASVTTTRATMTQMVSLTNFSNISAGAVLNVPANLLTTYQTDTYWPQAFPTIQAIVTGVNSPSYESIQLYPTVTTDVFKIKGLTTVSKISIFNIAGKVCQITDASNDTEISIKSLPKGIYYVKVSGLASPVVRKLLKK